MIFIFAKSVKTCLIQRQSLTKAFNKSSLYTVCNKVCIMMKCSSSIPNKSHKHIISTLPSVSNYGKVICIYFLSYTYQNIYLKKNTIYLILNQFYMTFRNVVFKNTHKKPVHVFVIICDEYF